MGIAVILQVYIQVNATLLNKTATWVQSGTADNQAKAWSFQILDSFLRDVDGKIPHSVVPQALKADWNKATAIHKQIMDIYQRWVKQKIEAGQVITKTLPLLSQLDDVLSDCEQIMASNYGFDPADLEEQRQASLTNVELLFGSTATPTPGK